MPVFIRPRRVIVDEGGSGFLVAAVLAAGAGVVAIGSVLGDIIVAALVTVGVLAVAGVAVLAYLLRRDRAALCSPVRPGVAGPGRSPAVGDGRPAAVEGAPPVVIPGLVLDRQDQRRAEASPGE